MSKYNIYKNDVLTHENINTNEVISITGIDRGNISRYTNSGKRRKAVDGYFTVEEIEKDTGKKMDIKFQEEWDKARFRINPMAREG